jgi:hypothetical protein
MGGERSPVIATRGSCSTTWLDVDRSRARRHRAMPSTTNAIATTWSDALDDECDRDRDASTANASRHHADRDERRTTTRIALDGTTMSDRGHTWTAQTALDRARPVDRAQRRSRPRRSPRPTRGSRSTPRSLPAGVARAQHRGHSRSALHSYSVPCYAILEGVARSEINNWRDTLDVNRQGSRAPGRAAARAPSEPPSRRGGVVLQRIEPPRGQGARSVWCGVL